MTILSAMRNRRLAGERLKEKKLNNTMIKTKFVMTGQLLEVLIASLAYNALRPSVVLVDKRLA